MFERFLTILNRLPKADALGDDDPRVAAAALLFHVIDADGVRDTKEMDELRELLSQTYGIRGAELDRVVAAGEEADSEAVDLYAFTSVINRHFDQEAKRELVAMMWEMVFSDGELHELEDNVVWRVAELIHVERGDRIALRQRAKAATGAA